MTAKRSSTGCAVPGFPRARHLTAPLARLIETLREAEDAKENVELRIGRDRLRVTSLGKTFYPKCRYTKGDLLRYYVYASPFLLPTLRDRPLVLRRYPGGVQGHFFFQQNAGDDIPAGVRVETIVNDDGEKQRRFIGGSLTTTLYLAQIGAISMDPWHSRVKDLDVADYAILDLDPGPKVPFRRVADVARWVRDTCDGLGLHAALKTSGSEGLHIYLPLPTGMTYDESVDFARALAKRVASAHPKQATVERSVRARPAGTVYVDYLQNLKSKSVASAYSARAKVDATVSMPLDWEELDANLSPRDFTVANAPARLASVGDLWKSALARRNSRQAVLRATA